MTADSFKDWRGYTPILLACITVLGLIVSFFLTMTLSDIKTNIHNTYGAISEVKSSLSDYEDKADQRFARVETELADIPKYVRTNI